MKKVLLNCQNSSLREFGGAARYVQKLIENSKRDPAKEFEFSYINYKDRETWDDKLIQYQKKIKKTCSEIFIIGGFVEYLYGILIFHLFFLSSRIKLTKKVFVDIFLSKKQIIRPIVYKTDDAVNVYHEPINYVSAVDIGKRLAKRNFAFCSTFLDVQDLYFPENFNSKTLSERILNYSLYKNHCDFYFAISEFTKKTMVDKLGIHPDKIFVTYLGSDLILSDDRLLVERFVSKFKRYWIYPAKFWPHKNHKFLIKGISALSDKFRKNNVKLILTGGFDEDEYFQLKALCEEMKVSDVIVLMGFVNDLELKALIKGAEFMVFPSLFEGFGMPIIEAMNLGCPVVSANGSSLSEIAKGGAHFFDPLDLDSWISVAELMLDQRLNRVKMIETAKKISSQYTWETTYRETLKIYKKFT